ncbi:MAG: acyltransferase [Geobacteraceae bacterium]
MEIKKEVSATLMISNLIATFLVIAIHYNSKGAIDISLGYNWNYVVQEFVTNGVARVAVPFFAMMSGFFLVEKICDVQSYLNILKNKSRTLLLPYILSSTFIFLSMTIIKQLSSHKSTEHYGLYTIAKNIFVHPISVQFWFLRDLIILTVFSPLILNKNRLYSFSLGFLLLFLWIQDIQPLPKVAGWYLINIETIFFFWIGGVISRFNFVLSSLAESSVATKIVSFFVWGLLISVRIYVDPYLDIWYVNNYTLESILLYKIAILVGLICLIQLSSLVRSNNALIFLSGYTFFVFLFHGFPLLNIINFFTQRIVNNSFLFYINLPVVTIFVFIAAHITSEQFNKAYTLITGGRSPNKAVKRM